MPIDLTPLEEHDQHDRTDFFGKRKSAKIGLPLMEILKVLFDWDPLAQQLQSILLLKNIEIEG